MTPFTVGCRAFEVPDTETVDPNPGFVLYPSEAAEKLEQLGPYTLSISLNAPVAAGSLPLVVISHGTGSSHLAYRTLAAHLARH